MTRTQMSRALVAVAVSCGTLLVAAGPARACGGFFCNQPQPQGGLPIAQAGENVLFVLDKGTQGQPGRVEAHIQIIYKGDAAQFSWVVPVTALPELDVGTDVMFDRIETATRPSFQLSYQMDGTCQGQGGGGGGCMAGSSSAVRTTGGGAPGVVDVTRPGSVEVAFRGNVGPYESAVIRSEDPVALETWLTTNGYYVADDSKRIIAEYVAAHSYFVALRLQQGKDTTAIRPIVLRMAGDEGCLPLKLTAIAATPDLRANVWVLGDARAVPLDYVEVGINQAKIDWFNFGQNYDKLLGEAANEAGGNAFAVEYAQPSAGVAAQLVVPPDEIAQLRTTNIAGQYLATLRFMGFTPTGQVLVLLRKYLPLPADAASRGITEAQYYANPYFGPGDLPFDPQGLTDELEATVFLPLAKVQPLFTSHRYLTRLATFISPEEMDKDPRFVTNTELPDVSPAHMAVGHLQCGDEDYDVCHAPVRVRLEDGTDVAFAVPASADRSCNPSMRPAYDRSGVDTLPSADVGWLRDATGEGHMVVDQRAMITSALAAHNATVPVSSGCGCALRGRGRPAGGLMLLAVGVAIAWLRRRRHAAA